VLLQQEKKRSSNKEHGQGSGLWDANRPCSVTIVPLLVADGRRPVAKDESSRDVDWSPHPSTQFVYISSPLLPMISRPQASEPHPAQGIN
jgi:hypothetical protein